LNKKTVRKTPPVVKNDINSIDDRPNLMSEHEVVNWLDFANELSLNLTGMPFTPQIINRRLQDVTLVNTIGGVTEDRVSKALENPKATEAELLAISESLEISNMSYKRILNYMSMLLAFSWSYSCINAKPNEYSSKAYQKDLDVLKEFSQRFDFKSEFKTVVLNMFREEMFFGVLRDEGERYTLQQLPSDKCLITGRWENGLLYSFDYSWFVNSGTSIDMYPAIFKKTYAEMLKRPGIQRYIPSLPIEDRSSSGFVWWQDCSPIDNFWGFKLSPQLISRIPYFSGMFPDFAMLPLIRGLQKSSLLAGVSKSIIGELPMLKDTKAKVSDMFALDANALKGFLKLLQGAINSEAVRIGSAPLQNMKPFQFDADHEILSSYTKTTLGMSGINSNLLFSGDLKPNVEESRLSVNVDEMISFGLYSYFERFVEYFVNRKTSKFKFKISFEGSNFYSDKERRWQVQKDNISYGIINLQKIASSQDIDPFVLQAQLAETKAMGFVDGLTPIVPAAQLGGNNLGAGAPKKSDTEISDSGSQTREDGGNLTKTKKVK
jgi:hypothetical protein